MTPDQHSLWLLVLSAFGAVLWSQFSKAQRDIEGRAKQSEVDSLKSQNSKQETDIATLQANGATHNVNTERLASAIERLDTKIDQLAQSLLASRRTSERPRGR